MTELLTAPARADRPPRSTLAETDGRRVRGERTQRRLAETLICLLEEGVEDPPARTIAERAGVSLRLVFHHFDDVEALYSAMFELQVERHWQNLPAVPAALPLERRIDRTAKVRAKTFETVSPVRRAGQRRIHQSPQVAAIFAESNARLRNELVATFSPELNGAGAAPGQASPRTAARTSAAADGELLDALDAAASWETWERLRRAQGLPMQAARRTMVRTISALLDLPSLRTR